MRKVIVGLAVSLDGMIEGPNGNIDWLPQAEKKELDRFISEMVGWAGFPGKNTRIKTS